MPVRGISAGRLSLGRAAAGCAAGSAAVVTGWPADGVETGTTAVAFVRLASAAFTCLVNVAKAASNSVRRAFVFLSTSARIVWRSAEAFPAAGAGFARNARTAFCKSAICSERRATSIRTCATSCSRPATCEAEGDCCAKTTEENNKQTDKRFIGGA